jgi:hypothetical protein
MHRLNPIGTALVYCEVFSLKSERIFSLYVGFMVWFYVVLHE